METFFVFLLGIFSGIIAGIFPGINMFVVLSLLYPALIYLDVSNILVLYITLCACAQYFGSVSGTFFSIPGSYSSLPSVIEGHALFKKGLGDKAIMHAAIGSFFASIFAIISTLVLLEFLFVFYNLFDTRVKVIVFALAILSFVVTAGNKMWISFLFLFSGLLLGHVGFNDRTMESFLTFGNPYLYSGLPLVSVVFSIFVIPNIIVNMSSGNNRVSYTPINFSGYLKNAKELFSYKWTVLKSSIIGYITGFIPGISYILGVSISYALVKRKKQKQKTYEKGDLQSLVASECANNSGSLSVILPLLLVGIPITASQSLIYNIAVQKGIVLSIDFFQSLFSQVILAYIATSIICVFISGKYVNWIGIIQKVNFNYIYLFIIVVLLTVTFIVGIRSQQHWFYLVTLLCLLPVGYIFRNFDTMPLIYGFLLSDIIYDTVTTGIAIYG